jgi:hypothetical protein
MAPNSLDKIKGAIHFTEVDHGMYREVRAELRVFSTGSYDPKIPQAEWYLKAQLADLILAQLYENRSPELRRCLGQWIQSLPSELYVRLLNTTSDVSSNKDLQKALALAKIQPPL